jgi:hypothetical protein
MKVLLSCKYLQLKFYLTLEKCSLMRLTSISFDSHRVFFYFQQKLWHIWH